MAHDDDKPEAGDDPWAGLEAEGLPELGDGFAFSFDDQTGPEEVVSADPDAGDAEPAAALDAFLDGGLEAGLDATPDWPAENEPDAEPVATPNDDPTLEVVPDAIAEGAGDADIDDWLSSAADGDVSASSVLAAGAFPEDQATAAEFPDFAASESSVTIGTGTSGIISPSGVDALGEGEPPAAGDEADPFAGLEAEPMDWAATEPPADEASMQEMFGAEATAADGEAADDFGTGAVDDFGTGAVDDFAAGFAVDTTPVEVAASAAGAAAGLQGSKRPVGKAKRSAPPRKKKPSVVGQLVGVVLGGAMAIPVTLGILIWGFGKDPFNLTPALPESVAFLLPAKFKPARGGLGLPQAPSLDDIVGGPPAAADEAALPSADDLADSVPEPEPAPVEPEPTDLAAIDPAPPAGGDEPTADPLMDLLDETDESAKPPAAAELPVPPAPEPLDLEKLAAAVAEATAALEAVTTVSDPSDPIRRRLLAKWYRALAGYAEELAALERLAAETGRPFEPAIEQGEAVRSSIADNPQLQAELSRLTRDWIGYAKRPSDGVVMPATFVLARRVGPFWRSQVSLAATDKQPAREMAVLTRAEPAVAPGDEIFVTGLAVDDDVIWASELLPAAAAAFPGL